MRTAGTKGSTKQNVVNRQNALDIADFNINFFVGAGFNAQLTDRIEEAIDIWRTINNCRDVRLVNNRRDADIIIINSLLGGAFGGAFTPVNGAVGTTSTGQAELYIDQRTILNPILGGITGSPLTNQEIRDIIAHEIGHAIGFRHSDMPADANTIFLHNTTLDDAESIMASGELQIPRRNSSGQPFNDLNANDTRAVRMMYPAWPGYTLRNFSVRQTDYSPFGAKPFKFSYSLSNESPYYELSVNVRRTTGDNQYVRNYTVKSEPNGGTSQTFYALAGSYTISVTPANYKNDFFGETVETSISLR